MKKDILMKTVVCNLSLIVAITLHTITATAQYTLRNPFGGPITNTIFVKGQSGGTYFACDRTRVFKSPRDYQYNWVAFYEARTEHFWTAPEGTEIVKIVPMYGKVGI